MKIFISTGEISGDIIAARLTTELRRRPDIEISGVAGPRTRAAGARLTVVAEDIAAVGVTEAFGTLPALARAYWRIRRAVLSSPPDVAVLIGNDLFNTILARWLRRHGVQAVGYFPPQVWIWRSLARPIGKSFDVVLASFPDESDVYAKAGAHVRFVGHYLADALTFVTPAETDAARHMLGLPVGTRIVGILPGSRPIEVERLTPVLLDAANRLRARDPRLFFVIPVVSESYVAPVRALLDQFGLSSHMRLVGDSHAAMRASDVLLLASGTATLEAALLGVPMVIVYKVSRLTDFVVRSCVRIGLMESRRAGLPNLILQREAVPELLQEAATPAAAADEAWTLLADPERRRATRAALAEVGSKLRCAGTTEQVASLVIAVGENRDTRSTVLASGIDPALPEVK
jgi:lipid-A-disaccharide synthase